MAVQRTPKANCTEHTIEINDLKKDMETRIRHEENILKTMAKLSETTERVDKSCYEINVTLLHLKDIPDRLRKLEDKSIVYDLIKLGLGIVLGVIINGYVQNNFIEPKRENKHQYEKTK